VCPVKINIPEVLIHLRGKVVQQDQTTLGGKFSLWNIGMQAAAFLFADSSRLAMAERIGQVAQRPLVSKNGFIEWMPLMLSGWTQTRDLRAMPAQSFRDWWAAERVSLPDGKQSHGG
jgi:L-lactate dehydrogenase complex protein LldF